MMQHQYLSNLFFILVHFVFGYFFVFAVSCSKGRFESKGNCELCGVGYYQYEIGRTYCKTCPDGKTTLGKGSTNVNDCSGICYFIS